MILRYPLTRRLYHHFNCRHTMAIILTLVMTTHSNSISATQPSIDAWERGVPVTAPHFMAVIAHPKAARVARQILAQGGSAMDAAVAAQLILNLVEPQSSGIGGGAFLLYWNAAEKQLYAFDGRETAPATATPNHFLKKDGTPLGWWEAVIGGHSVGVPGTLHLLHTAHRRFGRIPWANLFSPAVQLAEKGFRISPRLAKSIERAKDRGLTAFDASRRYFFNAAGTPRPAGSLLRNPDFARTLRQLAKGGIDPFYHGEIGRAVVDVVRNASRNPGSLTRADLARYRTIERTPVCIDYHQHRVCGIGPPSSGGLTVGQILGILSRFDLAHLGYGEKSLHLFAEASKLAYADRDLYMADHDFSPVPVAGLLDSSYLEQRADLIKADAALKKASAGHPPGAALSHLIPGQQLDRTGTSHLSIIDTYGNVLSMTTTIETGFGSRLMVGGFLLNNELTDFSFQPQRKDRLVANRLQGGKRPRSSMAPTIVFDQTGQPVMSIGSPGGSRIINYVAQAVIGLIDWKLNPQQVASQPHVVNRNGTTEIESGKTAATLSRVLHVLGHDTKIRTLESGLNVIKRGKNGMLEGGTDPRREGQAVGG